MYCVHWLKAMLPYKVVRRSRTCSRQGRAP
jgi:hypothetical protein